MNCSKKDGRISGGVSISWTGVESGSRCLVSTVLPKLYLAVYKVAFLKKVLGPFQYQLTEYIVQIECRNAPYINL